MKVFRSLCCAAAFVCALCLVPAQGAAQFTEGGRYVGFHIGMSGVGSAAAFGAQGEVAYNERISIGAWLDTWSFGESFSVLGSSTSWDTRYVAVAGTGAYHFPVEGNEKLDPFVGASLGYFVVNSSATGPTGITYTGDGSRIFFGGHAGVRYFFRENMSGVARAGVGASYLTLGMDFGIGGG